MNQNITDLYFLFFCQLRDIGLFKGILNRCNMETALINVTNSKFVVGDELVSFLEKYYVVDD